MSKEQRDREIQGYERMLERLRDRLESAEREFTPRVREALEHARDRAVELGELTREEADRVATSLRRDLEDAADYTARHDTDLNAWLRMDVQLVENWLWDQFSSVADRTRLEWLQFQQWLERAAEYHTGEIAGPGALHCTDCGETLTFTKAGHIPPCPKCRGTVYRRTPMTQ
ncbi:zinc ribbon-containing protein [Arhodomonas sp. AD133]|uniref:zinc ribbon-containing protein n=1 Tax=Arhodomonas sp. AD133 TaxID=3415009 RepID=UPI003EBE03DD